MSDCIDKLLCESSNSCNITITDINGLEIDTRYLRDGDVIYISVDEREGYLFAGFTFKPMDGDEYPVTAVKEDDGRYRLNAICGGAFAANYNPIMCDIRVITYPDDGLHGKTYGTGLYPYGTTVLIRAEEYKGYHFVGWYVNNVFISDEIEYGYFVKGDAYVVGKFAGDEYSIVVKPNDPLLGEASGSGIYEYGETVEMTATPYEGSYFVQWQDGNQNATREILVTGSATYTAGFSKRTYIVSVNISTNDPNTRPESAGVVTGAGVYYHGSSVTLHAVANEGYKFISWAYGESETINDSDYTFTITDDMVFTANFEIMMCKLSVQCTPMDGGIVRTDISQGVFTGGVYPYGTKVNVTAVPFNKFRFKNWNDGLISESRTFKMITDISAVAYFQKDKDPSTIDIEYQADRGKIRIFSGRIDVTQYNGGYAHATLEKGSQATVVVQAIEPYVFAGWDDESSDIRETRTFKIDENIQRTAYFIDGGEHKICVHPQDESVFEHGYFRLVSSQSTTEVRDKWTRACAIARHGEQITVSFIPTDPLYALVNWSTVGLGDMEFIENGSEITITVTSNGVLVGVVAETRSRIGVQNSPSALLKNKINFSVTYENGREQILTPSDNTEYTGAVDSFPNAPSYTVTVNEPDIPGYHFSGLFGSDGSSSKGENTIASNLAESVLYTCLYEKDGCTATFTFDKENAATVFVGSNAIRSDSSVTTLPGQTFTVSADEGYTITDVIDVTTGMSAGIGVYRYIPFPIPDSEGIAHFYQDSDGTSKNSESAVTVYDSKLILNEKSPQYVKLVRVGMDDTYAKIYPLNMNNPTPHNSAYESVMDGTFYDVVPCDTEDVPDILMYADSNSPSMLLDSGTNSLFAKIRYKMSFNVENGHTYRVCIYDGSFEKPNVAWYPIAEIPSNVGDDRILRPRDGYLTYAYFNYNNDPKAALDNGYRYADVSIYNQRRALKITEIQ